MATFERRILRRISGPLHEDGRFRRLHDDEIYERYHDRQVVDKIRLDRLPETSIYGRKKIKQTLLEIERWRRSGRQTAFRDIYFGAKPGYLEHFIIKAGLDRIAVVAPLRMMNWRDICALPAAAKIIPTIILECIRELLESLVDRGVLVSAPDSSALSTSTSYGSFWSSAQGLDFRCTGLH